MYFSAITTKTTTQVFADFVTSEHGLSETQASTLQEKYGLNQINAHQVRWYEILRRQFTSPFLYLLFGAAGIAFLLQEMIDGSMIVAFVLINTGLGFAQEFHSERSLALLRSLMVERARVLRDGKETLVESRLVVPGDIIIIETGDVIAADARLIEAENLVVDESALTGESAPVAKKATSLATPAATIYAAGNMVFSGTHVASGKGLAVVVGTAKNTVMGEISRLTIETKRESGFEKGIAHFSSFILRMVLATLAFLFVVNLFLKGGSQNVFELLLFSIALAVSVIPEALPVVTTISLTRGALELAKHKVVVKRLSAIEDLGSVEVLCTDKTGTITENKLTVSEVWGTQKEQVLWYGTAASSFLADHKSREPNNAFDLALYNALSAREQAQVVRLDKVFEIPFDPARRQNSVLVDEGRHRQLIVRGAPENIVALCRVSPLERAQIKKFLAAEETAGRRTIAVAVKQMSKETRSYRAVDERGARLVGLVSLVDPVKSSTTRAIEKARQLGVEVKILTGDSPIVAGAVAKEIGLVTNASEVITGEVLLKLSLAKQRVAIEQYRVFARMSPEQKYHVIQLLKDKRDVGFLGEGINDAPALKAASVGLVVEGASDIARSAADIVLLSSSLHVIVDGIQKGRGIFANTTKYIKATLISNFGNFYSVAISSLFINYLPMLPVQILLLNLLSDFPMITIATDHLDPGETTRPRAYQVKAVVLVAIILGLVSSVFDFIFFAVFRSFGPEYLQTYWFIGSVLTEIVLMFSIRTHRFFLFAKPPSWAIVVLSTVAVVTTFVVPFTKVGAEVFHFITPTAPFMAIVLLIVVGYFISTETAKLLYYRYAHGDVA